MLGHDTLHWNMGMAYQKTERRAQKSHLTFILKGPLPKEATADTKKRRVFCNFVQTHNFAPFPLGKHAFMD